MTTKRTHRSAGTTPPKHESHKKSTKGPRGGKAGAAAPADTATTTAGEAGHAGMVRVEREIGGRILSLETGRMAKLADGAVVARYGDTMVLATAQSSKAREDIDFFPLTVEYREKPAAAGKFPGGFFKREGRPTTKEILGCRIIDRAIRPLFPDGYKAEVQVLSQVLSTDQENESDTLAAVASFAALAISSIPHRKTLGACRIGCVDDQLVVNPTWAVARSERCTIHLTVAAHEDGVVMVEAGARQVPESKMLEAIQLGHRICTEIAGMIDELVRKAGRRKSEFKPPVRNTDLESGIENRFGDELRAAPVAGGSKEERKQAKDSVLEAVQAAFPPPPDADDKAIKEHSKLVAAVCGNLMEQGERESILRGRRADGRNHVTIRPISIEVGVLPRVHGSVLFTRGETQALVVATLGTADDEQMLDGIYPEDPRRFLLHYNFPPFSVGEVRRIGSVGRREIGHGALAERAVETVLPSKEKCPYTIRVTSEILESNGSSSMATVCGATLAMMDAGVQISQPVAGVAMGLVKEGDRIAILSDILGSEDHCGDMDFKVAGTGKGITALQMDIKCEGLSYEIFERALEQAKAGRRHVLQEMLKVMRTPRDQISPNAPRLIALKIPVDKIGLVIGPSGKMIRGLQEEFAVKINIEDDGTVTVAGLDAGKAEACAKKIKDMTAEVEVGAVYTGRVTAVKEFGAFLEILPGQEGLVHVSELSDGFVRTVTDIVRIGDELEVKVIGIDDFGKIKLSRKALLIQTGVAPAEHGPRGGEMAAEGGYEAAGPDEYSRPERYGHHERHGGRGGGRHRDRHDGPRGRHPHGRHREGGRHRGGPRH
jgi:polyribonucleotide nucleotidyltransferase